MGVQAKVQDNAHYRLQGIDLLWIASQGQGNPNHCDLEPEIMKITSNLNSKKRIKDPGKT